MTKSKISNHRITTKSASRIQSATAKVSGGMVPPKSFASRTQSAAAKNASSTKGRG